ncbi:translation machinery-associated protein 16 [Geopyxis carbonaria]|nr:translation machinery-associated protein 16 [Geopyxis carbonaria]
MPLALNKVTKKIRRKKGSLDALGDRDKKRVQTAAMREAKLNKQARTRRLDKEQSLVRAGFFKIATKDATGPLEKDEIRALIASWIAREDHELQRYIKERRPGRPQGAKHLALQHRIEAETEEFRTGFWMPDIGDAINVEMLKRWDGTVGSLAQVKFTRVAKEDAAVKEDVQDEAEAMEE